MRIIKFFQMETEWMCSLDGTAYVWRLTKRNFRQSSRPLWPACCSVVRHPSLFVFHRVALHVGGDGQKV